ncbi:YgaP family membrane protein [Nocardia sp. NPDC004415]
MKSLPRHQGWTVERVVPLMAGVMVVLSVALTLAFSPWWLLLTGFVGANLVFYSAVGWCPASLVMEKVGLQRASCRTPQTITQAS